MKILLVDDHPLFIDGLQALLEAGEMTVVGTARDGAAAVAAVREHRPDAVLMDIQMPGCDGLTATRLIKTEFPEIKIVILTMNDDDQSLFEAMKSGASGYLLKNLETTELLELLAGLPKGETAFSPGLAERLLQEFVPGKGSQPAGASANGDCARKSLTLRQEKILTLIAGGLTYKQVAELLGVSARTVRFHMNEILERLHLENRTQAIAYASQANLAAGTNKAQ
ncbi:response regulator [Sporomusa malonica]|uniref:response regulator n=1 Tax=Sporomusa malonica TaxID=112901 RepID=UPI00352B7EC8